MSTEELCRQHRCPLCGSHAEIAALLRWLHDGPDGPIEDIRDAIYVVAKPWKWHAEYDQMLTHERETAAKREGPALVRARNSAEDWAEMQDAVANDTGRR